MKLNFASAKDGFFMQCYNQFIYYNCHTHSCTHTYTEKGETHLINKYNDRSQLAGKGEESLCELFSISKPLSQETGNRKPLSNIQKQKTMTTQTENARLYQLSMI